LSSAGWTTWDELPEVEDDLDSTTKEPEENGGGEASD
jgi:hypothetical protein